MADRHPVPMQIRGVVTKYRKPLKLSQNAIARAIGMDQGRFSRLLNGRPQPKLNELEAIAEVLNIPTWRLILEADDEHDSSQLGIWIAYFESLPPDRREHLRQWLLPDPPNREAG